jgi:hypothetical protein
MGSCHGGCALIEPAILYTDKRMEPFLVDVDDADAVTRYSWAISHGYPVTSIGKRPNMRKLALHLFLMGPAPEGTEWDHIDRNKRNNQRSNLRTVTSAGNKHNLQLRRNNTSGHHGVGLFKATGRWRARIKLEGKEVHIGMFSTREEAIEARRVAESRLWAGDGCR